MKPKKLEPKKLDRRIVFGVSRWSPLELSISLSRLRVSHTMTVGRNTKSISRGYAQPLPVHISNVLTDTDRPGVNFIVVSAAELAMTNYAAMPVLRDLESELRVVLPAAQLKASIVPTVKLMRPIDYVNEVAKPSVLNKIQTEIYKIQPYSLRKQVQGLTLDYLSGRVSGKKLKDDIGHNLRLEHLVRLLFSAESLRNAVKRFKSGAESVEVVSAATGHPTFELLYLSKERK